MRRLTSSFKERKALQLSLAFTEMDREDTSGILLSVEVLDTEELSSLIDALFISHLSCVSKLTDLPMRLIKIKFDQSFHLNYCYYYELAKE